MWSLCNLSLRSSSYCPNLLPNYGTAASDPHWKQLVIFIFECGTVCVTSIGADHPWWVKMDLWNLSFTKTDLFFPSLLPTVPCCFLYVRAFWLLSGLINATPSWSPLEKLGKVIGSFSTLGDWTAVSTRKLNLNTEFFCGQHCPTN